MFTRARSFNWARPTFSVKPDRVRDQGVARSGITRPPQVELRIYYLGQMKVRQKCRPEDAARAAALWRDVMGMRCEVIPDQH